jgi:hypothetical protein
MKNLLKRIGIGLLAAILAFPASGYNPNDGYAKPTINTPFNVAVADIPIIAHFIFGSAATAPTDCAPGGTCAAITNATQLATYWSPYEIATGTVTVNAEMENYQPFTNTENFVFATDHLALTATLDGGTHVTLTGSGFIGNVSGSTTSFTAAQLGAANCNAFSLGQIFIEIFLAEDYVTGISGSGSSCTVTTTHLMGTSTQLGPFFPWTVIPVWYAQTSSAVSGGSTTIPITSLPASVTTGMVLRFYNNTSNTNNFLNNANSSQEYVITGIGTNTVSIASPGLLTQDALGSGQGVFFLPQINSAMIWSNATWSFPGWNGQTFLASKIIAQLPQNATVYNPTPSSAPANAAEGAWPAWWWFAGATNSGGVGPSTCEFDNFEFYNESIRIMKSDDMGGMHPGSPGGSSGSTAINIPILYLNNPPYWSVNGNISTFNSATDYSQAYHEYDELFQPDRAYSYIDNTIEKVAGFRWTSSQMPQMGANLAVGSLLAGIGTNGLYPLADTNFPMTLNIKEIVIYGK